MLTAKQVDALLKQALGRRGPSPARRTLTAATGEDAVLVVRRLLPRLERLAKTEGGYAWSGSRAFAEYLARAEILQGVVMKRAPFEWEDLRRMMELADVMGFRRASLKRVLSQLEARTKRHPLTSEQRRYLKETLLARYGSGWHGHRPIGDKLRRMLAGA